MQKMEEIISDVAKEYGISKDRLISCEKSGRLTEARRVVSYLAWATTDLNTIEIGKAFGGRDHSRIINAREALRHHMEEQPVFKRGMESWVRALSAERTAG